MLTEQAARERATDWLDGSSLTLESLAQLLLATDREAREADPAPSAEYLKMYAEAVLAPFVAANLVSPDGGPRRVKGTLPITADGVIVMMGEEVFHPDQDTSFHLEAIPISDWLMDQLPEDSIEADPNYVGNYSYYESDTGFSTSETYPLSDCYSTPEAAASALAARGGVGNG